MTSSCSSAPTRSAAPGATTPIRAASATSRPRSTRSRSRPTRTGRASTRARRRSAPYLRDAAPSATAVMPYIRFVTDVTRRRLGRGGARLAARDRARAARRRRPGRRDGWAEPSRRPRRSPVSSASRARASTPRSGTTTTTSTGERVAVIGTGASSVQFVPRIQPEVGSCTVFQRTPSWVMPDPDRPSPDGSGGSSAASRPPSAPSAPASTSCTRRPCSGTIVDRRLSKGFEQIARRHLRQTGRAIPSCGRS